MNEYFITGLIGGFLTVGLFILVLSEINKFCKKCEKDNDEERDTHYIGV